MTPEQETHRRPANFPTWLPAWASQLADLYFSGTTAAFVLHGNTYDLFRVGEEDVLLAVAIDIRDGEPVANLNGGIDRLRARLEGGQFGGQRRQ